MCFPKVAKLRQYSCWAKCIPVKTLYCTTLCHWSWLSQNLLSDWNLTKYPAGISMTLSCYRKPIHQNHKWVQNSSRKWVYISKQLFQNKVSSGRRTVQCPQTKAVATTIVQWQFHVVKTYKCDTVWQSISDVQKYSTTMSIPVWP